VLDDEMGVEHVALFHLVLVLQQVLRCQSYSQDSESASKQMHLPYLLEDLKMDLLVVQVY
jgi:hypothetical protein